MGTFLVGLGSVSKCVLLFGQEWNMKQGTTPVSLYTKLFSSCILELTLQRKQGGGNESALLSWGCSAVAAAAELRVWNLVPGEQLIDGFGLGRRAELARVCADGTLSDLLYWRERAAGIALREMLSINFGRCPQAGPEGGGQKCICRCKGFATFP